MSINYHAYQNRGYRFSTHEVLCEQWTGYFTDYDPSRIAGILHLDFDEDYLYIPYLYQNYRLNLFNGSLEKQYEDEWQGDLYFNESMSIYHLLYYTKDNPVLTDTWVPFEHLEEYGYRQHSADPLLDPFSKKYSGKSEELEDACRKLGGIRLTKGDVLYKFEVFPRIFIQMIFWDADEDFPAQTQIFVDKNITEFVHAETVGCMISDLLEKLESF